MKDSVVRGTILTGVATLAAFCTLKAAKAATPHPIKITEATSVTGNPLEPLRFL